MHVCVKMMSKGSKEALTVLIVTQFVTHVKRVESVLCIKWPLTPARREAIV